MYGVTVYPVIGLPPSSLGAVQLTSAELDPGVAKTPVGATGAARASGVTGADALDTGPEPAGFEACTLKVYCVPGVSPLILALVAGGVPLSVVGVCAVDPMYGVIT